MCFNVDLLLRVKDHDRIIVSNDPVNFIDPLGLHSLGGIMPGSPCAGSCHASETGSTGSIELTSGQANALKTTAAGAAAIAVGVITENPQIIGAGIPVLAEGAVLTGIEFGLNGDTGDYPSPLEIVGDIVEGMYDALGNNEECQENE